MNQEITDTNEEMQLAFMKILKIENEKKFYLDFEMNVEKFFGSKKICLVSSKSSENLKLNKLRILTPKRTLDDQFWKRLKMSHFTEGTYLLGHKKNQYIFLMAFELNLSPKILDFFKMLFQIFFENLKIIERLEKEQSLIYIDDVSGLYNQRKLNLDLQKMIVEYESHKKSFSVLFLDIDFFKKVNDGHGHLVGTRVLEMMSKEFRKLLREEDLIYRYGGDEFVVILPETERLVGEGVANRILDEIKSQVFHIQVSDKFVDLELSLSIGVAECPSDASSVDDILSFADRMMYEAKTHGRGTVFSAQGDMKNTKNTNNAKKVSQ